MVESVRLNCSPMYLSTLRVGVPLQIYARYQAGDLIPGRYTRPANIFSAGIRVIAKFW